MARDGGTVPTKQLDSRLSPRSTSEGIARHARQRLHAAIERAFEEAGRPAPEDLERVIVVDGRKGYRLGVSAVVIEEGARVAGRG